MHTDRHCETYKKSRKRKLSVMLGVPVFVCLVQSIPTWTWRKNARHIEHATISSVQTVAILAACPS
eukprot:1142711-Pelagomonas_calceolata.AAC.6